MLIVGLIVLDIRVEYIVTTSYLRGFEQNYKQPDVRRSHHDGYQFEPIIEICVDDAHVGKIDG